MALNRRQATDTPKSEKAEGSGIVFTNLSEGDNEGRLVFVADLGLQRKEYMGEFKGNVQQISLGIEIVGKSVKDEEGNELPRLLWTKPFYIYPKMSDKSKEFEYYRTFDPMAKDGSVPDWEAQLGKPCNVIVEHVKGKGDNADKVFDNINSLTSIPAKYQDGVEANRIAPCIGDADDEENEATKALYGLAKYVFDKRVNGNAEAPQKAPEKQPEPKFEDEDIPF